MAIEDTWYKNAIRYCLDVDIAGAGWGRDNTLERTPL
jgi:hypothetical protein